MPLMKSTSKGAFAHNVKAEIAAGKPARQAVAIAYATKRSAGKKSDGEHHSAHSQKRSDHYHSETVKATPIDRGAARMTRQAATRGKAEEAWDQ
jgi:hypothetical protein